MLTKALREELAETESHATCLEPGALEEPFNGDRDRFVAAFRDEKKLSARCKTFDQTILVVEKEESKT